ncbi:MAG: DUF2796 domain-containing protein [Leptothrix sp. (in: Bacteria)]|nr:DUF2796 domain-containing protein [Leptothrix sp. (in: b-proteobacteria)]
MGGHGGCMLRRGLGAGGCAARRDGPPCAPRPGGPAAAGAWFVRGTMAALGCRDPGSPMNALSTLILAAGLAAAALPAPAAQAHQHGVARLDVAVEPSRVTLYLYTPLDNLLGFERAPRSDVERQQADAVAARLQAADRLFRVDGKAGCKLAKVTLSSAALGLPTAAAAPAAGDHADLEGRFEFACTAGASAGFVEVSLFEAFPQMKRLELQLILPRGQMKATLVRPATRVTLVR